METKKMSLAEIKGKLSRAEMKSIMAGSFGGNSCPVDKSCWHEYRGTWGKCYPTGYNCQCVSSGAAISSPDCIGYWA
ncbi:MAG: hypothetical protein MUE71_07815 [Chitinophagaceae bacterium]|jgi:hypothetical protein|nr:hypothetical protein [Chitinophagaceae bacterium]